MPSEFSTACPPLRFLSTSIIPSASKSCTANHLSLCLGKKMVVQSRCSLVLNLMAPLIMAIWLLGLSFGFQHIVGDSVWSIPPTKTLYAKWSSSHHFFAGDTLFFDFESDLHNVMQVSRREYEECTASQPFQAFTNGPAIVPLFESGVFYFICNVSNYCTLGQKLTVIVDKKPTQSPPIPVSSPPPVPSSESPIPSHSQTPAAGQGAAPPTTTSKAHSYWAAGAVDWNLVIVCVVAVSLDRLLHCVW